MNRLRQPSDSDYDVLGVSPGATDDEIEGAFRQLIDGEGYRVGVPFNRQWLRAHQIKAAHARLSNPAKRRAYDEALSRVDPPLWVARADDPATDALVVPRAKPSPAKPIVNRPAPVAEVPSDAVLTGSELKKAPDKAPRSDAEDRVGPLRKAPPLPGLSPPPDDNEGDSIPASTDDNQTWVRSWGVATAAAFALGLVLLSPWLNWYRQPSTIEETPGVALDRRPASVAGSGSAERAGNLNGAAASGPEGQSAPAGDSPVGSEPRGRPFEGQSSSNEATKQEGADAVPTDMPNAQSPTTTKPAGITRAAAKASSLPANAAGAPIRKARAAARSSSSQIGSPPQWIGGGPTDADNRRGRYQGTVALQVNVEPNGRVSNCAAVRGSGNARLDALTCRLVRERARFTPARDARGRPVVGQAYTTFAWVRGQPN